MGYRIRVLSTSIDCIPVAHLESALTKAKLKAAIRLETGTRQDWTQIILAHSRGPEIALIERDVVEAGSLGAEELKEFAEEVANCKPASAAQWLIEYFSRVRSVYALQLLSGTEHKNGWNVLGAVKNAMWAFAPSIFQADAEGFSNEDGYHILWQFSDTVTGSWWMGVLRDGDWVHFEMDLGNRRQREAFFRGEVPEGARLGE